MSERRLWKMKICGVLTEMYDGTMFTRDQITNGFGADTFEECLKRNYIAKAGFTALKVQMYQITAIGKAAFDNKTY